MKFVAHRGESQAAPENSLESFTLAWSRGVRCVEGDFHLTKDEVIVCMHDTNAKRTCGVDRELEDMTLAEIKALDCGSWKSQDWKYTRVPTLEEILQFMPENGEIFVELKIAGRILDKLEELLDRSSCRAEQIIFIAFDPEVISATKKRFPAHLAYWLYSNGLNVAGDNPPYAMSPEELVAYLHKLGVDGADLEVQHHRRPVSEKYIDALHKAGLSCNVWVVDDPEVAKHLIGLGIDSITTNRAYALKSELKQEL